MNRPAARLLGVSKRFGTLAALSDARLEVYPGEVHGVLGENGAGKTTLLRVLGGMVRPDAGTVEVQGRLRKLKSPRDAWAAGVGMVHQHFTLVPTLSVLENLVLGRRTAYAGLRLPMEELRAEVAALMGRTGLMVPLDDPVGDLGVGSRQRVEILKALLRQPRLLVLDEPTAVLAPAEVDRLFALLRDLAADGGAVVLVAHKLDEVLSVANRVTVLRQGGTVLTARRSEVDAPALIRAMVGTPVTDLAAVGHRERPLAPGTQAGVDKAGAGEGAGPGQALTSTTSALQVAGDVVAVLEGAGARGGRGEWAVEGADLAVARGEIIGVAGVEGNGQRELALMLAGRLRPECGRVVVPRQVALISQDRGGEGLIGDFDITANMALALHDDPAYTRGPFLDWAALRRRTAALMERFDVRADSPEVWAGTLSGGNQQRVVVARELSLGRSLVVAENPTRGLDVGATAFVHRELVRLVSGADAPGVVLLSTDLDEILALSHRIYVMVRGRLTPVPMGEHTREGVGAYMLAALHG